MVALMVGNGSCERGGGTKGGLPQESGPHAGCPFLTNSRLLPVEWVRLMESDISVRRQNHCIPEGASTRTKFLRVCPSLVMVTA